MYLGINNHSKPRGQDYSFSHFLVEPKNVHLGHIRHID